MSISEETSPLDIHTVSRGFYEGFNPVVSMTTKLIVVLLVVALITYPQEAGESLDYLKTFTLTYFGDWYIYLMASFVGFCGLLLVLPISGRIKLGAPGDIPEYSTHSWLAMMFCSGIGVGILVFSVSEPISHHAVNPDIIVGAVAAQSQQSVSSSLRFVFLHWGFSAWTCYALIGLALGLACHRHGQPMTMRSAVAPLFGKLLEGSVGHVIDMISILAIVAGITTTIVLGLEQICSGLSILTGSTFFSDQSGNPPLTALLTALVVAISIAIGSITSGINRGVKWVSNFGMMLAFGVLSVFALSGSAGWLIATFFDSVVAYFQTLPAQIMTIYEPTSATGLSQSEWQSAWTIFYWAWWIAFAPFVGLFLARISRGRTVREFILGAVLGPTFMCFLWFSVIGGSAILMELDGTAAGSISDAAHAFRIYETIHLVMGPGFDTVMELTIVVLFLVLIVASTTAAITAIKSIGAAGGTLAETPTHSMMWAIVIAAITGAVMAVGGVQSIRDLMIVGAVPFSGIMALMVVAVSKILFDAWRADSVRI